MTYDFSSLDSGIAAAKEWLQGEYQGIRTGRATPSLLDGIQVPAYGSLMKLNQVAAVSMEDPRTLRVTPFDHSVSKDIEKAIRDADFGVGIGADERGVRVSFPDLTSERRTQLLKLAKDKMEQARVSIRKARDEVWSDLQAQTREGTVSEDDKFRLKEQMEKAVTAGNEAVEALFKKKEAEIAN